MILSDGRANRKLEDNRDPVLRANGEISDKSMSEEEELKMAKLSLIFLEVMNNINQGEFTREPDIQTDNQSENVIASDQACQSKSEAPETN